MTPPDSGRKRALNPDRGPTQADPVGGRHYDINERRCNITISDSRA